MKLKFKLDESTIAKTISAITNPAIILVVAFVVSNINLILRESTEFFIFITLAGFFPLSFYLYEILKHKSHHFDFTSISRSKRDYIFLTVIIFSLLNTYIFLGTNQNRLWAYNAITITVLFSIFFLVNRYLDKISMHSAIFTFSIFYLSDKISLGFSLLLIFLPFVCWARIELHKHTWSQLLLGVGFGMFVGLLSWVY